MGAAPPTYNHGRLPDEAPRSPAAHLVRAAGAGYRTGALTAETVTKLCQQGQVAEAVEALGVLVQIECCSSSSIFYTVLKACVVEGDVVLGRRIHSLSVKQGYESDTFLSNHILRMYASLGRLGEAKDVFFMFDKPDAFMWSSIILAYVKQGQTKKALQLYHRMQRSSVQPDPHVFVAALQACAKGADLKTGQEVHADLLASGLGPHLFVWNCLVDMYAKCGNVDEARKVFDQLCEKDVVTWNAMISGYSQQGMGEEALRLYSAMQEDGTAEPDSVTYISLLQACAGMGTLALEEGKDLHAQIRERGHHADLFVANSLVNMYAKCGSLEDAQIVFDGLHQKDVVTWTALIVGYSQKGMGVEALQLHSAMQEEGVAVPNAVTFSSLLQACAIVGASALEKGKQLHAEIRERGFKVDVVVGSSLVNMYAKCGSLEDAKGVFDGLGHKNVVTWTGLIAGYANSGSLKDAQRLFDELPQKDVVTWNAMIAGYCQQGLGQNALQLYRAMQEEGTVAPNAVTFVCLLQACANVAALHLGRDLHAQIEEQGLEADVLVAVSLINMYAKSGSMVDAQQVFEAMPTRNCVSWNALIAGYSRQGDSDAVFNLLLRMRAEGVQPDSVTFLSILTVCSHAGLLSKGQEYFEVMISQHGISPTPEHYTCIVDLLGRAGQLEEALALVKAMPVLPDAAVWHTLLAACRKWRNVDVGHHVFQEAVKLDEKDAAAYILMSAIYTTAQMWEQAQEIQAMRREIKAWKQPGESCWTDMNGWVHAFVVGDENHPESEGIHAMLKQLFPEMKEQGYVPHLQEFHPDICAPCPEVFLTL